MRIRTQLALLVVTALSIAFAGAVTGLLSLTRGALETETAKTAQDAAEDLAHDLQRLPPLSDEAIERRLQGALSKYNLTEAILERETGDQAVEQFRLKSREDGLVKQHAEALSHARPRLRQGVDTGDDIEGFAPFSGDIGTGVVRVSVSMEPVRRQLAAQTRNTLSVVVVSVLLAGLFVVVLADVLLGRRLARLGATMREVSEGALERRVPVQGPTEVRGVSAAFNLMLDRLQEADRAVRRFNERLADEVAAATRTLSEQNSRLETLNGLLLRAREDLAQRERMAALGQLAAQLAHEVGTPLGSVSGHLQLALADAALEPSVRERLGIAREELARVSRIIRDYLDSTRRLEPAIVDVRVDTTLSECVEISRGGSTQRSAAVAVQVEPAARQWSTDEGVVRQVVVNLVANALDAVSSTERRSDAAAPVRVSASVERRALRGADVTELLLRVEDDGPGLTPEQLGRIFEPFYTTKGRGKGTGLGLAICRELVQAVGGRIDVAATAGAGTSFVVRLPDGRASRSGVRPAGRLSAPQGGVTG